MNERRWRRRVAAVTAAAITMCGGSAATASAERQRRCDVAGFVLPNGELTFAESLPDDRYNLGWVAEATTTLDCGSRGVIGIDVWEHAYYVKVDPKGGNDDVVLQGKVAYRLTGDFDGDGSDSMVHLDGRISGNGVDNDGVVTATFAGSGSSSDGSRIRLRHRGTFDLRREELRDLDVTRGVFNPAHGYFF